MGTIHHLHVTQPRQVPPGPVLPLVLALPLFPVELLPVVAPDVTPPAATQPSPATEHASARCREKGCIFPARAGTGGRCLHHWREENEPAMFLSRQPIRTTVDQAKFYAPVEPPVFGSRFSDRVRFAKEREAFFET